MTDTNKFRSMAKEAIVKLEFDRYNRQITHEDIEVVFMGYVLGNMKATFVIPASTEGRYYEVSYSNINNKMFVDEYKKEGSIVIDY